MRGVQVASARTGGGADRPPNSSHGLIGELTRAASRDRGGLQVATGRCHDVADAQANLLHRNYRRRLHRRDRRLSFSAFPQEGEHFHDLIADFPETFPAHARGPLGITAPNQRFDTVLMGRVTYDVGAAVGLTSPYPHLAQYVFSRSMQRSADPQVTLVSSDALPFVRSLKQRPGSDIWLCGGGKLAADLFSEIDELILKINPLVFGQGRPLFARGVTPTLMSLIERKAYDSGYVRMHYALR